MNALISHFEYNFFTILKAIDTETMYAKDGVRTSPQTKGDTGIIQNALCKKQRILLALSGGSDSVALAYLLHLLQKKYTDLYIACVYINHRQQEQSEQKTEYDLVKMLCARMGFDLFTSAITNDDIHKKPTEAVLREERYKHIIRIAIHNNCNSIMTAHHQDDLVETMLMRLFEGKAGRGLGGIPQYRLLQSTPPLYVIRPCIAYEKNRAIAKNDLLSLCTDNNLPYHTDVSNENTALRRNLIRNTIVPYIKHHYPHVEKNIYTTAIHLREVYNNVFCISDSSQWMIEKKIHNTIVMLSLHRHMFEQQTPLIQKYILYTGCNQMGIADISESFLDECISERFGLNAERVGKKFHIEDIVIIKHKHTLIIQRQKQVSKIQETSTSVSISTYLRQSPVPNPMQKPMQKLTQCECIFPPNLHTDLEKKSNSNTSTKVYICGTLAKDIHGINYTIDTYGNECIEYLKKNDTIHMNNHTIKIVSYLMKHIHTQSWNDVLVLRDTHGIAMVFGGSVLLPSLIRDVRDDCNNHKNTHTIVVSYEAIHIMPHAV